jgi:hypothetical protein
MPQRQKRPTMKCLVTGVEKKYSMAQLKRRINKFGSVEELKKHWISREAAAYLRKGYTVDEVRETLKVSKSYKRKVSIKVLKRLKLYRRNLIKRRSRDKQKKSAGKVLVMQRSPMINILEYKDGKFTYPERIKDLTGNGVCIRPDLWNAEPAKSCDNCHYAQEKYGNLCRCPTKLVTGKDSKYNDLSLDELRQLAEDYDLPSSGIKKTLVARLVNSPILMDSSPNPFPEDNPDPESGEIVV